MCVQLAKKLLYCTFVAICEDRNQRYQMQATASIAFSKHPPYCLRLTHCQLELKVETNCISHAIVYVVFICTCEIVKCELRWTVTLVL